MNVTAITGRAVSAMVSALLAASPAQGSTPPDGVVEGDPVRGPPLSLSLCLGPLRAAVTACEQARHEDAAFVEQIHRDGE